MARKARAQRRCAWGSTAVAMASHSSEDQGSYSSFQQHMAPAAAGVHDQIARCSSVRTRASRQARDTRAPVDLPAWSICSICDAASSKGPSMPLPFPRQSPPPSLPRQAIKPHQSCVTREPRRPLSATGKVRPPYSLSTGPWPTDLVQAESLPHSHEDVNHVPKVRLDLPSLREDMSSINVKFNYSPENRGTGAH